MLTGMSDLYCVLQNMQLIRKLEAMAAKKVTLQIRDGAD